MPIAAPTMADSLMGVSITRSQPKRASRPFGDLERAAIHAHILAEQDDGRIAVHFLGHGLANCFEHGDFGHQRRPRLPRRLFSFCFARALAESILFAPNGLAGGCLEASFSSAVVFAAGELADVFGAIWERFSPVAPAARRFRRLAAVFRLRGRFHFGGGIGMRAPKISPPIPPSRWKRRRSLLPSAASNRLRSCGSLRNRRPARRAPAAGTANSPRIPRRRRISRGDARVDFLFRFRVPQSFFGQKFFVTRERVALLPLFEHFLRHVLRGVVLRVAEHAHGFRFDQHRAVSGASMLHRLARRA